MNEGGSCLSLFCCFTDLKRLLQRYVTIDLNSNVSVNLITVIN